MTKHTVPARIALFMTLAALAPLAAQDGGGGAASFSANYVPTNFTGVTINEYGNIVGALGLLEVHLHP